MFVVIRREGGSRILTITRFLPADWQAVEVTATKPSNGNVTLKIKRVQ